MEMAPSSTHVKARRENRSATCTAATIFNSRLAACETAFTGKGATGGRIAAVGKPGGGPWMRLRTTRHDYSTASICHSSMCDESSDFVVRGKSDGTAGSGKATTKV